MATPAAGFHPAAQSAARKWAVVLLVCVGVLMTTLDASIVNISLPSIATAFDTPLSGTIARKVSSVPTSCAASSATSTWSRCC